MHNGYVCGSSHNYRSWSTLSLHRATKHEKFIVCIIVDSSRGSHVEYTMYTVQLMVRTYMYKYICKAASNDAVLFHKNSEWFWKTHKKENFEKNVCVYTASCKHCTGKMLVHVHGHKTLPARSTCYIYGWREVCARRYYVITDD